MATADSKDGAAPEEASPPAGDAPPKNEATAPVNEVERGAALPAEEMGFSNSTLHWLADGESSRPTTGPYPITSPSFDPTAPVAGRRRAVLVVGGAAIVAFVAAGSLEPSP